MRWPSLFQLILSKKPRKSHTVMFYTKSDCGLCKRAEAQLSKLAKEYALDITIIDVEADEGLWREYALLIPVVVIDGKVKIVSEITEEGLRRALTG